MILPFTKMHGLGNDFVVFDGVNNAIDLTESQIRDLANRHTGVGFDQMLVAAPASAPDHDFRYLVWNADGRQAEVSGNGARCITRFIHDKGLSPKSAFSLLLINGKTISTRIEEDGRITVNMGVPDMNPAALPFNRDSRAQRYPLTLGDGSEIQVAAVSVGNPHAVLLVDDIDTAPVSDWGPLIENHPDFPNRVNAGFMQVVNAGTIRLRVYERGTGETLACGSGACAAVVAGIFQGLLDHTVDVQLPRGVLTITWQGGDTPVYKTGPATSVFEGSLAI